MWTCDWWDCQAHLWLCYVYAAEAIHRETWIEDELWTTMCHFQWILVVWLWFGVRRAGMWFDSHWWLALRIKFCSWNCWDPMWKERTSFFMRSVHCDLCCEFMMFCTACVICCSWLVLREDVLRRNFVFVFTVRNNTVAKMMSDCRNYMRKRDKTLTPRATRYRRKCLDHFSKIYEPNFNIYHHR